MTEYVSIIIPVYNEEQNVVPLCHSVLEVMDRTGRPFEILFINDGSNDATAEMLDRLAAVDPRVRLVTFRRNYGQTAALMAGFNLSKGSILISMDGDLQNDPNDIPALLAKLEEGFSVVSGWRKDRQDAKWSRVLPSKIANLLISKISGVSLHDYGCTLKAYRRDIISNVQLYGEMHRFIPIYASWQGAKVAEVEVNHFSRQHGTSKYGLNRIFKVLLDLIVVKFLEDFHTKPIYVFGTFGLICLAISIISGVIAVYLRLIGISFILTPLPLLVVFTCLTGFLSILLGLLAELLIRVYYESQGKPIYVIRSTSNLDEPGATGTPAG